MPTGNGVLTRLGVLFRPICLSAAKYPVVLLEFDHALRNYILLSQTFPAKLPPLPQSPATWSVTNLQGPSSSGTVGLSIIVPDHNGFLSCETTQHGADLFLGVRSPEEFDVSLSLSGTVIGSVFVDYPLLPSPPSPLPTPSVYDNIPVDGSFPPGFEYSGDFLWPSQINTFYPWYYIMYQDDPLPPLEMIPYIPTEFKSTSGPISSIVSGWDVDAWNKIAWDSFDLKLN